MIAEYVEENNEDALLDAVNQQPVSVAIQANTFGFRFYHKGVFDGNCGNKKNYYKLIYIHLMKMLILPNLS